MGNEGLADAERALIEGDFVRGERLARRELARAPTNARAHELVAYALARKGDEDGALEHLRHAARQKGGSAAASHRLGVMLRARGDRDGARDAFEQSIARDADFFPAIHDLATLTSDSGHPEESLALLDRAMALAPDSFEVHHNRGRVLHALRRHEEAVASYARALSLHPDHAPTLLNRGDSLDRLRRYDEAIADYRRAVEVVPGFDDARWNESLVRLLLGEFQLGWELYECRWSGSMAWPRRHHDVPAWKGEPIAGKRVLVWWEQGFGDTLHFCRYLPMVAARGAQVVFEVQPPLAALMKSVGDCEIVSSGADTGACDYQVPLLSLPGIFGTTLETIPAAVPYLAADPSLVQRWKQGLGAGRKIGVVSSGHLAQKDNAARSVPLSAFAPLKAFADLFVIQVEVSPDDRDFARQAGSRIHLLDDRIGDFSDSAAIVENMDAIVTVDSAVAHLAGALAKPALVMLPWAPTWRWMIDREDSPWYPTMRLVRQQDPQRWDDVFHRVHDALPRMFPGR